MHTPTGRPSYAVTWRDGEGPLRAGKLELRPGSVRLEGGGTRGRLYSTTVRYGDLAGARMVRAGAERLRRRPTLVIERPGRGSIWIASVDGLGRMTELFERLVPLIAGAV
jgi:hypothetical protein